MCLLIGRAERAAYSSYPHPVDSARLIDTTCLHVLEVAPSHSDQLFVIHL